MQAFMTSLNITDPSAAASNLSQLKRKPYPSLTTLKKMQRIMAIHDPRVLEVKIEDLEHIPVSLNRGFSNGIG
jgi:hypothetical protein